MDTNDTNKTLLDTRMADDYDGILTKPVMISQNYTTWDIALMR